MRFGGRVSKNAIGSSSPQYQHSIKSDHETSLVLAMSILVGLYPCIYDIIHLAGSALGIGEESGDEFDGCAVEYAFTEDTVIVHPGIDGSAEKAFAWIHEDPAGHHASTHSMSDQESSNGDICKISWHIVHEAMTHIP